VAAALIHGLIPSVIAGLYFGGFVAIDRMGVRLYLHQIGEFPLRSRRFLSTLHERGIMVPYDRGYKFLRDEIRDGIGQLSDLEQAPSG